MTAVWSSHIAPASGAERVQALEDEAIHVIREAWGQFERPALQLGDSATSRALLHVVEKAFWPARVPFELIDADAPMAPFDAVLTAAGDEWDHRVPTGIFAVHDEAGSPGVCDQRRDLWDLYNGRRRIGEKVRVVPLSNWTSRDVSAYLDHEGMSAPSGAVRARAAS